MNQHLERLAGLAPFLQRPIENLIGMAEKKLKATLMVVYTFRSVQQQLVKWQQGRHLDREQQIWVPDDPIHFTGIVTNALPGTSPHNVIEKAYGAAASVAVDLIELDRTTGEPNWNPTIDFCDRLYELAWKVGVDPLGDTIGAYYKPDLMHFEEPGWKEKLEGLGLVLPSPTIMQV